MWLIAGLGNPGKKYILTRHNIGFMAVDSYIRNIGDPPEKKEHKALTYHFTIEGQKVIMAKPQTYMNDSGESIQPLMNFYKITPDKLIVIHDEVDFPFLTNKLQKDRSPGGQNGVKSIHQRVGTSDYYRIRLGVGRPNGKMDVASHVLSPFNKEELEELPETLSRTADVIETLICEGFNKAATEFNVKA